MSDHGPTREEMDAAAARAGIPPEQIERLRRAPRKIPWRWNVDITAKGRHVHYEFPDADLQVLPPPVRLPNDIILLPSVEKAAAAMQKKRTGDRKGGKTRGKQIRYIAKETERSARKMIETIHSDCPLMPYVEAVRTVAGRLECHARTVRRHTEALRW